MTRDHRGLGRKIANDLDFHRRAVSCSKGIWTMFVRGIDEYTNRTHRHRPAVHCRRRRHHRLAGAREHRGRDLPRRVADRPRHAVHQRRVQPSPAGQATSTPPAKSTAAVQNGPAFRTARNRPLLDALEDDGVQPETACRSVNAASAASASSPARPSTPKKPCCPCPMASSAGEHNCVAYPITDLAIARP